MSSLTSASRWHPRQCRILVFRLLVLVCVLLLLTPTRGEFDNEEQPEHEFSSVDKLSGKDINVDIPKALTREIDRQTHEMEQRLRALHEKELDLLREEYERQLDYWRRKAKIFQSNQKRSLRETSSQVQRRQDASPDHSHRKLLTLRKVKRRINKVKISIEKLEYSLSQLSDHLISMNETRLDLEQQEADACTPAVTQQNFVLPSDTELVRPASWNPNSGLPIVAPITAYTWKGTFDFDDRYEKPIYQTLDRESDDFWNYLVDELLLSRTTVIMLHGRGCYNATDPDNWRGPGEMCPRVLQKFIDAVYRANASDVIQCGMFDATGAYRHNAGVDRLDFANVTHWDYFWSYNIKIWFETIPREWWYLLDGERPIIASWTIRNELFENQEGNVSLMLAWLRERFQEHFGVEPAFILQSDWFKYDSTLTEADAAGVHGWFKPVHDDMNSVYTLEYHNNDYWGMSVPGFRNGYSLRNCSSTCRHVTRRNGTTFLNAMTKFATAKAKFILLEGWTDMIESAGFYRSDEWLYPTQYINLVRRFSDPTPETLRFQAEGADAFFDTSIENEGRHYANRSLDVRALDDGSGWYVGYTVAGEWLEYQNVQLGCGTYRFTARVATRESSDRKVRMQVWDAETSTIYRNMSSVEIPSSGGLNNYILCHLGETKLYAGTYNLRLLFESTGSLNVDWFFLKRSATCSCEGDWKIK